jgi:hypothetical protein
MIKVLHQQQERQTWLRTLDYIQQETIYLKNQLAEVIKNDIPKSLLEKAEYFQNEFLNKDAVIALLRYDIAKQNKAADTDPENENKTAKKQDKLRSDMEMMEKEFSRLKFDFNSYLSKVL